ncbi:SRPBCC family protein [Catenuloplanes japonicus]|uniref:SRPBCC family protein n=1 Tax=Catenuloplanes japonicus TaxID=33876 RepID=UPI000524F43B|nr:SRPBCC family protein [Catenuloplanes japonicus]
MIDVVAQVNAVRRQVGARTLEAGEARVVTATQTYDAPVEDVWDACTTADRLARWFTPVTGELKPGGRYELHGNASGTVTACDPPRSFDATWEFGGEVSWIEVRLTAEGPERTRLTLDHIAHVDDERWAQFGPGAVGLGWDLSLMGLAMHLTAPDAAIDPAVIEAWSVSEEGRTFVTLAGEDWRRASVAAGTPPEQAEAAAKNTTEFYSPPSA